MFMVAKATARHFALVLCVLWDEECNEKQKNNEEHANNVKVTNKTRELSFPISEWC